MEVSLLMAGTHLRQLGVRPVDVLDGEPAAGGRQLGDPAEDTCAVLRREVHQHALDQPGDRLVRVETRGEQRRRPVLTQVGGDDRTVAGGPGPPVGQCLLLEGDQVRQVDLEQAGALGPVEPERAGVQARGEQDHLPRSRRHGLAQPVVEEAGAQDEVLPGAAARLADPGDPTRGVGERTRQRVVEEPVGPRALGLPGLGDHHRGAAHAGGRAGFSGGSGHSSLLSPVRPVKSVKPVKPVAMVSR
ncbi:hypothetical protein GCM10018952_16870 [Streptosporangium vulgare]